MVVSYCPLIFLLCLVIVGEPSSFFIFSLILEDMYARQTLLKLTARLFFAIASA